MVDQLPRAKLANNAVARRNLSILPLFLLRLKWGQF